MPSNENFCCLRHNLGVETILNPPDESLRKSRSLSCDLIEIEPFFGAMSGMKAGRNLNDCLYAYVRGKPIIHFLPQERRFYFHRRLQMSRLAERVHSRVGAARPLRQYLFAGDPSNG